MEACTVSACQGPALDLTSHARASVSDSSLSQSSGPFPFKVFYVVLQLLRLLSRRSEYCSNDSVCCLRPLPTGEDRMRLPCSIIDEHVF